MTSLPPPPTTPSLRFSSPSAKRSDQPRLVTIQPNLRFRTAAPRARLPLRSIHIVSLDKE